MTATIAPHPCFNSDVRHTAGRVHLPVAPDCNLKCNYCNREYDCVNESRPGVTSAVLTPEQALHYLEDVTKARPEITVAGLAGPGDPFAKPAATLRTLALVRERFPELLLCVSSNGLNLEPYIDELVELGVGHLTLTINAVDPEIGSKIYAWAVYRKQVFRGLAAAELLLSCQLASLEAAAEAGMTVKVNTILIPGVNEEHVGEVARVVAGLGAHTMNCMPMYPVTGTPFADYGSPSREVVSAGRAAAGGHIVQMAHCARCRADAVGILGEAHTLETVDRLEEAARWAPRLGPESRSVAVATLEGLLVSEHLGRARHLAVYSQNHDGAFEFLEARETPPAGTGAERWRRMAEILSDCSVVLAAAVGEAPKEALATHGIEAIEWTGLISDALETLAKGETLHTFGRGLRCGAGCGGGEGC